MMNTLLSPEVALGIVAALAILAIYDVVYVWPIHRRISALTERYAGLERSLAVMGDEVTAKLVAGDSLGREDVGRLGERLAQLELATEARSYEHAIGFAERGEDSMRLISCFGLTEGEAELVTLLHGDPVRRAELAKSN